MEKTLVLQPTNHEPAKTHAESMAQDMEKHSGIESFMQYAREKATTDLSVANSWNEAHGALAVVGISIQARGNGLVLVDQNGGIAIKASSIGREFSKAKLEKRLGPFAAIGKEQAKTLPGAERRIATYSPKPVTASHELYQQYLATKHATSEAKTSELAALWEKQCRLMREVREAGDIRLPAAIGKIRKRALQQQIRESVKAGVSRIRGDMAKLRAEIKVKYKTRSFVEWLKLEAEQGNVPAIYALRKRGAVAPALVIITVRDLRNAKLVAAKIAHVTGRGTLFYKVGQDTFRDNGSHVSLKRGVSDAGVESTLRIAMVKFNGQPLIVTGTNEFKTRCVEAAIRANLSVNFSDIQMEQTRQMQMRLKSCQLLEIIEDRAKPPASRTEPMKPIPPMEPQGRGASR